MRLKRDPIDLSNVRKAVICFQFSDRIKSELFNASKLLGKVGELKCDALAGGKKVLVSFLEASLHACMF